MSGSILGLATAVPAPQVAQDEAQRMTTQLVCRDEREARFVKVLFRSAGVSKRHTVVPWEIGYSWKGTGDDLRLQGPTTGERMRLYEEHAPRLATQSAKSALDEAGLNAAEVTHLVTVSCTGFSAPGVDLSLLQSLALRPTVERVHVGYMGCHGAINGLRVAQGLLAADRQAVVLLCAVETCSLHYRLDWDAEGIKGNALFADGSASLVLGHRKQAQGGWILRGTGSCVLPASSEEMSWTIGDHGFEMRLTSQVPPLIREHLRPWMSAWLDRHGLSIEEIGGWGVHPGGPKILDAAESSLGLPSRACTASRDILHRYGNMSSPTVLFVFDRLRREVDGPVVLLAFGPGLTAEAALLEYAEG